MGIVKGFIKSISFSTDGETFEEFPVNTITSESITGKLIRPADVLRLRDWMRRLQDSGGELLSFRDTTLPRYGFATDGTDRLHLGRDAWTIFCSWCADDPSIVIEVIGPEAEE